MGDEGGGGGVTTSLAGALTVVPARAGAPVHCNASTAAMAPKVHLLIIFLLLITAVSLGWVFLLFGSAFRGAPPALARHMPVYLLVWM